MDADIRKMQGFEQAVGELKAIGARRILLQFPEGLKLKVQALSDALESMGFQVVVSLQECFGACDLRSDEAARLGCDAVLHVGHGDFGVKSKVPAVYWEYFYDIDAVSVVEKEYGKIEGLQKIGLVASVQFVNALPKIRTFLEGKGKTVFIKKSLGYEGQILGCNLDAAAGLENDVDGFICVTAGKFYGLGLAMKTDKPVLCVDVEKGAIVDLTGEKKRILKTMAWNKAAFDDANIVALLVSWKPGQMRPPFDVKKRLEESGKKVYVFAMDEITPDKLIGLKIEAAVNLGCPRIGMDDLGRYKVPIVGLDQI